MILLQPWLSARGSPASGKQHRNIILACGPPKKPDNVLLSCFPLVSASSREVKAVSLLAGTSRALAQASVGETILANSLERYCGVDADSGSTYDLSEKDGVVSLMAVSLSTGEIRERRLPETLVVGPFRCGDLVFAYTGTSLWSQGPSGLRGLSFPKGFKSSYPVCNWEK